MEKKVGTTHVSKVSYGPKIANIWLRDMPKFTFFCVFNTLAFIFGIST